MKKIISVLLCAVMAMAAVSAFAAENMETDVLVIGGGGAGISAAIAAAEQGG